MKRYSVRARRVGDWWALDVLDIPGIHTQVRRLEQAEAMVRDAIAGVTDTPAGSFELVLDPEVLPNARVLLDEATAARSQAATAQDAAARLTRDAARLLVEGEGLTMRDAGVLLGVSHQRIAQLVRPRG